MDAVRCISAHSLKLGMHGCKYMHTGIFIAQIPCTRPFCSLLTFYNQSIMYICRKFSQAKY